MASSKKIRILYFLRRCWTPAKMIHPCASVWLLGAADNHRRVFKSGLFIIKMSRFRSADKMTKKLESVGRGINYSETRKVSEKLLPRGLRNFFFQRLRHHFFDLVLCIIFSFSVSTGPPSLFIIIVDFHPLSLS